MIEIVTRHKIKNSIEILFIFAEQIQLSDLSEELSRIDRSLNKHCKSEICTKQLSLLSLKQI